MTDPEIVEGIRLLARTEGIFAETAGGVTIANLAKFAASGLIRRDERVVAYITGNGLKTLDVVAPLVGPTATIKPTLEAFNAAFEIEETVFVSVTIRIPTQLRTLTGGAKEVSAEGTTVGEVLKALDTTNPGIGDRLFDDAGVLRRFVNIFVADEDVHFLDGLETPVLAGQTVSIVPAVAGG